MLCFDLDPVGRRRKMRNIISDASANWGLVSKLGCERGREKEQGCINGSTGEISLDAQNVFYS